MGLDTTGGQIVFGFVMLSFIAIPVGLLLSIALTIFAVVTNKSIFRWVMPLLVPVAAWTLVALLILENA